MLVKNKDRPLPAVEKDDYYSENGFLVFTEKYHLKRGFCCGNGCRHCPFRSKTGRSD